MFKQRTVATAALATLILGSSFTPLVLAKPHHARPKSHAYHMSKKSIYLNWKLVSRPFGLTGVDPNTRHFTTYLPIWYVLYALKSVGVQHSWNGRDLNVTAAPGMTVTLANLHPGHEHIHLSINGTLVDTTRGVVARDPYSHVRTTYIPIWYVEYLLRHLGITNKWDGHRWAMETHQSGGGGSTGGGSGSSGGGAAHLTVSAATDTVGAGQPDALSVVEIKSNGSSITLQPSQLTWTTSDQNDAFVSPSARFIATKPGVYTVTAHYDGMSQAMDIHVFGGTASIQLQANGSLIANGASTMAVTVSAVDADGTPNHNENGTVEVTADQPWLVTGTASNGKNMLGRSVAVTLKNGVGTVNIQASTAPGVTIQLSASSLSDAGNSATQYGSIQVVSQPQRATTLTLTPANGSKYLVANQSGNTATMDVTVTDQTGQPMQSGSYPFAVTVTGNATYAGPATGVYVGGQPPATITLQSKEGETGTITVSVSGSGLSSATASIQAVIATQAAKLQASTADGSTSFAEGSKITYNLTAVDQSGVPTRFPSTPFTVYVTNAAGQPATHIQVNGVTETANGVALGSNHSITLTDTDQAADAGAYAVTLKDSSGNTWGSFTVAETAATTSKLNLSAASTELPLAQPNTAITLQYTDAYGNLTPVPTGVPGVKVVAADGQGSSTLNGQDATQGVTFTPDSSGKVSATFSAQPYAGSTWKLKASDGRFTSNTVAISVVSAIVSQATVALQDASTGSATQATAGDALRVTFGASDSYNNPYGGGDTFMASYPTVSLADVKNGSTANGVTSVTGTLSELNKDFADAHVATAQTLTIQLADQSVSSARTGSASIQVLPGQFHGFAVFNSQGQLISSANPISISSDIAVEVWVRPVDALNNPVGAVPATYTVDLKASGSGSFRQSPSGSDMTAISFPVGAASMPVYFVAQSGSYALYAAVPSSK